MKRLTREWVEQAEGDFATACRERRARKVPNYDAACFHAQQCVEKYLKALLQEEGIGSERTHNLGVLLDAVLSVEPIWESFRTSLNVLNAYAVASRYPGASADKETAADALRICREIRNEVRRSLCPPE